MVVIAQVSWWSFLAWLLIRLFGVSNITFTHKHVDMGVHEFVNCLTCINNVELLSLHPYGCNQALTKNKLMDIIFYAVPKSWINKLTKQGMDSITLSKIQLVKALKCQEQAEDFSCQEHHQEIQQEFQWNF